MKIIQFYDYLKSCKKERNNKSDMLFFGKKLLGCVFALL